MNSESVKCEIENWEKWVKMGQASQEFVSVVESSSMKLAIISSPYSKAASLLQATSAPVNEILARDSQT